MLVFLFFIICCLQTIRMYLSYNFLTNNCLEKYKNQKQKMFLLIPVYNEQKVIKESVEHFSQFADDDTHVIFITTDKEKKNGSQLTTRDILETLSSRYCFTVINCPIKTNAVMAHQLNYAIKKIYKEYQNNFIIGVYNVDSRINKNTLLAAKKQLGNKKKCVVQQYTIYNIPPQSVLSHISLWQTRWTLHFELGRLLFDKMILKNIYEKCALCQIFKPFHYVIGHGLFMDYNTWQNVSGFPQDEPNEDAFLGLMLYFNNYEINTIPILEYAEIAQNIKVYIKQQSVWFNGPLFAFRYLQKALSCKNNGDIKRTKIESNFLFSFFGAVKLYCHALYWLLGPIIIWLIAPCYYIYNGELYSFVLWIILAVYHCYFLNLLAYHIIKKTQGYSNCDIGNVFTSVIAYLLHSVGPIYGLYKTISGKNTISNKYKTEK